MPLLLFWNAPGFFFRECNGRWQASLWIGGGYVVSHQLLVLLNFFGTTQERSTSYTDATLSIASSHFSLWSPLYFPFISHRGEPDERRAVEPVMGCSRIVTSKT
jgi:hypothetical protein